ncbi:MAG: DUF3604 domain-containing protein, partial [Oscillospiraceae bacterium]|nr:DUF3604 domain-containing protein [Oscillospiraceae bacterium]
LYYFAKDEGFLDFGAITDHSEGITDRQWDYMCMVAEDFNVADEFSTLVGQEWTSFSPSHCGHRNVYYRDGKRRPIMRADDPKYDELEKLYAALKDEEALIIPHHSSNAVMGVEWNVGFDEKHEIAAEMHSCWGSSELSEEDGNIAAIKMHNGTKPGRFVMDALRMGRKYGFVGGGDIHCGRPGDSLPFACWETEDGIKYTHMYVAGFTCVSLPQNTRENIYDAIKNRATWVTTQQRYYLEYGIDGNNMGSVIAAGNGEHVLHVLCATNEDIVDCRLMGKDGEVKIFKPDEENKMRIRIDEKLRLEEGFYYIRVTTAGGNMAWASPIWITK